MAARPPSEGVREPLLEEAAAVAVSPPPLPPSSAPLPSPDAWPAPAEFFFLHMLPVFSRAVAAGRLALADVHALAAADDPARAARLAAGPSLLAQVCTHRAAFARAGVLLALATAGGLAQPLLLGRLVAALAGGGGSAYALCGALFVCVALQAATLHRFWYVAVRVGLRSQLQLQAALAAKALALAPGALARGKLANLMATDAARLNDTFAFTTLHWQTWAAAVSVAAAAAGLWSTLGAAGLAATAALLVCLPLISVLTRATRALTARVQARRDARGRLVTELVAGVATLRLYEWLEPFLGRVRDARRDEAAAIRARQLYGVAIEVISVGCPVLILAAAFGLRAALDPAPLAASDAFAAVAWVQILQFPLRAVPYMIQTVVDCTTSLSRLRAAFAAPDADVSGLSAWTDVLGEGSAPPGQPQAPVTMTDWMDWRAVPTAAEEEAAAHTPKPPSPPPPPPPPALAADSPAIAVERACFGWPVGGGGDGDEASPLPPPPTDEAAGCPLCGGIATPVVRVLHDVSLTVPRGTLTLVCGAVGAGKSSLLSALAGEAVRVHGRARVRGRMAYCAQVPWLLNRSLRDNVTVFGSGDAADDASRLAAVLRACALDADVAALRDGLDTLVGDAGITLSGGQKHRVALARALYADADVILLDDVLGALDAIVAAHVWREAIVGLLLARGKTVFLATHAVHFAASLEVAQVVVLERGAVIAAGAYTAVVAASAVAARILAAAAGESGGGEAAAPPEPAAPVPTPAPDIAPSLTQPLAAVEGMEAYASGSVQLRHIGRYVRAMGSPGFLTALVILFVATQVAIVAIAWWLAVWVADVRQERSALFYAAVYGALNGALVVLTALRATALAFGAQRAGCALQEAALAGVAHAPARFFATTPAGRILNRFLADQATVDDTARLSLSQLALTALTTAGSLVVVAIYAPAALVLVAVLAYVYVRLARGYRFAARDLRRLQSVTKSPILQNFAELVRGAATARAFGPAAAAALVARHLRLSRSFARAYVAYSASNELISTALELLGAVIILGACLAGVWAHERGALTTAGAGLLFSLVMQLPSALSWLIRYATQVEIDAVAVERLAEFADVQSEEADAAAAAAALAMPPPLASAVAAGAAGGLAFDSVRLRYGSGLPLVLDGFSLHVAAGCKIALVGRTGAGKSTALLAALRLYPAEAGCVSVGGCDVTSMSVAAARRLTVALLQDGFVLRGTVRENLCGPGATAAAADGSDAALWRALEEASLDGAVRAMPGGLDAALPDGGASISAGERALLCLARALLRQRATGAACLLADEPTSSVDHAADEVVHRTLLALPQTVALVAHRLRFVPLFDLVAVVEAGRVVELGAPRTLEAQPGSAYAALRAAAAGTVWGRGASA